MLIYHGKFVIVNYTILPVVLSRGDSSGIRKICPRESSGWISWGNLDATIPSLPESSTKRKAVTWFVKGGLEACRRLYDIGTNRPLRTIRSPCTFDRKTFFPHTFSIYSSWKNHRGVREWVCGRITVIAVRFIYI